MAKTPRRKSREQIKEQIVKVDPTSNYKFTKSKWWGETLVQGLPPWRLWTGRMMLDSDPIVNFALNVRNAALMSAEVTVECNNPMVQKWIEDQWKTLWDHHRTKLTAAKKFGFNPIQIIWKMKNGIMQVKSAKEFAPEDVRCLQKDDKTKGFSVKGRRVFMPQALWMSFHAEYGNPYGSGCLRRMYPAWYEKWMEHGAKKLLQLRMIKDSYVGDIFWYPPNLLAELPDGTKMPWKDLMRELGENRLSGSALTLPRIFDDSGKPLTDYQPPQDIGGGSQIFEWNDLCDKGIFQGADLSLEVVEAAEVGSGYSGRSIPLLVALSVCNIELTEIVQQVDEFMLRPGVYLNWGKDIEYKILPKNLVETFGDDAGGTPMGGSAIGGSASDKPPQQVIINDNNKPQSGVQFEEHQDLQSVADKHHGNKIGGTGAFKTKVYRSGSTNDHHQTGVHYGHNHDAVSGYEKAHNQPIAEHHIEIKNAIHAPGHEELHKHLFKKDFHREGEREANKIEAKTGKFSLAAGQRVVEKRMANKVKKMGHDAILYTKPSFAKAGMKYGPELVHLNHDSQHDEQFAEGDVKYSCAMVKLPAEAAVEVLSLAKKIDRDDLHEKGVELEPHVTIKYGIHTNDVAEVKDAISEKGPIAVGLGLVSYFEGNDYDVLKMDVESNGIKKLNKDISENLEVTDTFPDYKPHCTIAYLKPGTGKKWADELNKVAMQNRVVAFNKFTFSTADREHFDVFLRGDVQFAEDYHVDQKVKKVDENTDRHFFDSKHANAHVDVNKNEGYIGWVEADEKGKGHAHKLLTHAINHLKKKGVNKFSSFITHDDVASKKLHEKLGFKETSKKKSGSFWEHNADSQHDEIKFGDKTLHAPPGGVTIHGVKYEGGEFIPGEVIAELSTKERQKLRAGSIARHIKAKPELAQKPAPNRKPPGSQLDDKVKNKLRELGMVGTFPPADVPLSDIKIADLNADLEELKYKPLIQWNQKTKSGRTSGQYRYTQHFIDRNANEKFDRVSAIEPHLEEIGSKLESIVKSKKEPSVRRESAAIANMIRETGLRPTDGDESVKHGHFGISSLQARHVKYDAAKNQFNLDFIGKEGVRNQTTISNPTNVAFMKEALKGKKGEDFLFTEAHSGHAGDLLKEISKEVGGPEDIKVKDLRTVKATQTARNVVENFDGPPPPLTGNEKKDVKLIKSAILKMSETVSKVLNNTPTQARDNYIHPEIFKQWQLTLTQK